MERGLSQCLVLTHNDIPNGNVRAVKAALINIFALTMDEKPTCKVKGAFCSD